MMARSASGSRLSPRAVEPATSEKTTVTVLRLSELLGGAPSGTPGMGGVYGGVRSARAGWPRTPAPLPGRIPRRDPPGDSRACACRAGLLQGDVPRDRGRGGDR